MDLIHGWPCGEPPIVVAAARMLVLFCAVRLRDGGGHIGDATKWHSASITSSRCDGVVVGWWFPCAFKVVRCWKPVNSTSGLILPQSVIPRDDTASLPEPSATTGMEGFLRFVVSGYLSRGRHVEMRKLS